jgi:hypothetical protein
MTRDDKLRITRLLGVGIKDVRQLHIGDMGTENGWYPPYADGSWMKGGMERYLLRLCHEQNVPFVDRSRWACYGEYWAYSPYNVGYCVDSSG